MPLNVWATAKMFDNNNQEILEKKWETTIVQALKYLPLELRNVIHTSLIKGWNTYWYL